MLETINKFQQAVLDAPLIANPIQTSSHSKAMFKMGFPDRRFDLVDCTTLTLPVSQNIN